MHKKVFTCSLHSCVAADLLEQAYPFLPANARPDALCSYLDLMSQRKGIWADWPPSIKKKEMVIYLERRGGGGKEKKAFAEVRELFAIKHHQA